MKKLNDSIIILVDEKFTSTRRVVALGLNHVWEVNYGPAAAEVTSVSLLWID